MRFRPVSLILMLVLTLIVRCEREDVSERPFPRVRTLPVTDINSEGAEFNAEITYRGPSDFLSYGFIWSESEDPSLLTSERVIHSGNIQARFFSIDVSGPLREGVKYYIRSFIRTPDYLVLGNVISFVSLGCSAPVIDTIIPLAGTVGDRVILSGKNFSYLEQENKIFFNSLAADVFGCSDTTVVVGVPSGIDSLSFITFILAGNGTQYPIPFRRLENASAASGKNMK